MALNKSALGALIKANLDSLTDEEKRNDILVWTEVADAIVTHITTLAEVNTTVTTLVNIPTTSVPPLPSSGSGTGTGTGTIS